MLRAVREGNARTARSGTDRAQQHGAQSLSPRLRVALPYTVRTHGPAAYACPAHSSAVVSARGGHHGAVGSDLWGHAGPAVARRMVVRPGIQVGDRGGGRRAGRPDV